MVLPGAVGFAQTAGGLLGWHPHLHLLLTDGGWLPDGTFSRLTELGPARPGSASSVEGRSRSRSFVRESAARTGEPTGSGHKISIVLHRHLEPSGWTLAAIDDLIEHGRLADWLELRDAARADPSLLVGIGQICTARAADPLALRHRFWDAYVRSHTP